jgi:hypothetical protein
VVANGFLPTYTPKPIIPEERPVEIALKPHDLDRRAPSRVLRGRVVNENGDPVARAVVEPFGFRREQSVQFGGLDEEGIDPLAVSDDEGHFRLGVGRDGEALYLRIKAPFLASMCSDPVAAGPKPHTFTLGPGVTVSGRLLKDGKPLAQVGLGMVQRDRNVQRFVGDFEYGTGHDGRFSFTNIPPGDDWAIYGLMDGLKPHGAIPVRHLRTGNHGETVELGDIEVRPGHRVSGRIVLADGKPLPPDIRVLLTRDEAWDNQLATAGPDGTFAFVGVPPERVNLSARVPGYHVSAKNTSYDLLNQGGLLGKVEGDVEGLRFLFEPGPSPRRDFGRFRREDYQEYQRRRDGPLRGAPLDP